MQCGYRAIRCMVANRLLAVFDSLFMQLFAVREKINERAFGVLRTGLFQDRKRLAEVWLATGRGELGGAEDGLGETSEERSGRLCPGCMGSWRGGLICKQRVWGSLQIELRMHSTRMCCPAGAPTDADSCFRRGVENRRSAAAPAILES